MCAVWIPQHQPLYLHISEPTCTVATSSRTSNTTDFLTYHGTLAGQIQVTAYFKGSRYSGNGDEASSEKMLYSGLKVVGRQSSHTSAAVKNAAPEAALVGTCVAQAEPWFAEESTVFHAQLRVA
ncbi:hypothetical protein T265_08278 [Opisthorchis viverrini]|uniref:Uncharacterized protein n=1 Tax=Opisthorchis viverrini TaxID=6198 RepID=A0A074ZA31_OPIVI|nr:hypothetical protein T265_08278 [Opisthorchis viverrini]KER23983.1 hypothetical protein T265_08278 [Opisthorchis viverrini]